MSTYSPPTRERRAVTFQGVKFRRAVHQEAEDFLKQAIKVFSDTGSLKKSIKFLVAKNFMSDNPQEIASFLRVYKNSFDPSAIGEYLGEGGVTPYEEVYWSQIRFRYTRAISFVELEVEPALRLYLTGCGFRLPGEAQKINRFVEVFVKAFWQDNQGTVYCPFRHPDTVHLLSYAAILLNTDLHRANTDNKKQSKKMTKEQFQNNLKGTDQGHNIDIEYLSRIYENIKALPIELAVESNEAGGKVCIYVYICMFMDIFIFM
jgi:Sec7-like guanine-nucleotide exchange factor